MKEKILIYPVILTECDDEAGHYYGISSPNIKGMVTDGKTVRRNISLPEELNNWAKENNINVSQVTTNVLREMKEA